MQPLEITDREDGKTDVKVRQLVKSMSGEVLSDSVVWRVYTIVNGLIQRMDLSEREGGSAQAPSAAFAIRS